MDKWNPSRYIRLLKKNKRDAYKYVASHNKTLIKDEVIKVPKTAIIDVDKFKEDITEINETKNRQDSKIKENGLSPHSFLEFKESKIFLMNTTVEEATLSLLNAKYNVAVLNICDSYEAGGFYTIGYETPEEELCRIMPALYNSLKESNTYPFNCYNQILYTPELTLLRNSKDEYNRHKTVFTISVISASPPNLNIIKFDKQRIYNILEMIFFTPRMYDKKNAIVLSSFACGENTKIMAKLFSRLLRKHRNCYKVICFAIQEREIYDIFFDVLNKKDKSEKE